MSVIDAMIYLYVYQLSDIAILSIKGSDYCCITGLINKIDAINYCKMLIWRKIVEHYKTYILKWVKKF